ncbi:hypothetical protein [Nitrosopumilus sp.]|uniref:hypothetical protein n=1 Tax=Nitrosopumilus sp. TaxID=2024843 RepID=UPI00247CD950|nr:hypothetical protein [Nitrosopumilus sp.]MCV0430703.1 hypothetical protein [Nitrosopumilus sp.]
MTYGLILVKGISNKRDQTLTLLDKLIGDQSYKNQTGTEIEHVFVSFGWPDIVLLIKGENIELIKNSIIRIRDLVGEHGDNLETSTIICTTISELKDKEKALSKL